MTRIRNSLFIKVYLTVLGSLALVALVLALMAFLGKLDTSDPFSERLERFAIAMYPAEEGPLAWQVTTDRLASALDADITLFGPDRSVLASAGHRLMDEDREDQHGWGQRGRRLFVAQLPDGRMVAALTHLPFTPPRGHLIGIILLIAAATGVAAFPVVRHITRRLEKVRLGMERWGAGAIATRIDIDGKDELAAVAATFNQAADRIEELINAQKSLLANASHELRSPLARLRMAVEIWQEKGDPKLKAEIVQNLGELDDLVGEILLTSRLDGAQAPALDQTVDLLALTAEEAAAHGVDVSGDPAIIDGNGRLLRRMVRNLIQNALRHGAPPVSVTIRAGTGGGVILTVRDHGQGIGAEEATRIFEPFYRPAGRGEAAGGWGLGLALVRQIAQIHGGSARYEQPDGLGAQFIVELPGQRTADHP
jgi:signal transduction histidine kinase